MAKKEKLSETYHPKNARPNSAYVHVPFCRHRCGYCNFSLVADRDYLIDRYLDAIAVEISWLPETYELNTLFLGGGTPTHLNGPQLKRLFEILATRFVFASAEVTSEANPSDLSNDKINQLADLGVNRFSLGVQSFSDSKLKLLERDHDAKTVSLAAESISKMTSNFSIDLIFATMNETLQEWQKDLRQAVLLQPAHVSTYELTIEKGTQFWKRELAGELVQANEELRAEMYEYSIDFLERQGYQQYEISSFAKQGSRCQHNLIYWSGDPYFAFGAGASRFIDGVRETNHGSVSSYIKRIEAGESPASQTEKLSPSKSAAECLVIGLRKIDGVVHSDFQKATQHSVPDLLYKSLPTLTQNGLIESNSVRTKLTRRGVLLYDAVASEILKSS